MPQSHRKECSLKHFPQGWSQTPLSEDEPQERLSRSLVRILPYAPEFIPPWSLHQESQVAPHQHSVVFPTLMSKLSHETWGQIHEARGKMGPGCLWRDKQIVFGFLPWVISTDQFLSTSPTVRSSRLLQNPFSWQGLSSALLWFEARNALCRVPLRRSSYFLKAIL